MQVSLHVGGNLSLGVSLRWRGRGLGGSARGYEQRHRGYRDQARFRGLRDQFRLRGIQVLPPSADESTAPSGLAT